MLSSPCPTYQSTTNKNKSKRSVQRENRNKKICRQVPALPTKNKLLSDTSNLLQVSVPQEKNRSSEIQDESCLVLRPCRPSGRSGRIGSPRRGGHGNRHRHRSGNHLLMVSRIVIRQSNRIHYSTEFCQNWSLHLFHLEFFFLSAFIECQYTRENDRLRPVFYSHIFVLILGTEDFCSLPPTFCASLGINREDGPWPI